MPFAPRSVKSSQQHVTWRRFHVPEDWTRLYLEPPEEYKGFGRHAFQIWSFVGVRNEHCIAH